VLAEERLAGSRANTRGKNANRRGLSRPVWSQEAEDFPRLNFQRDSVQGGDLRFACLGRLGRLISGFGRAERKAIEDTIRQPVRVLVSSTFHNNYSKGNLAYADVWKIGHENYRTDLFELMQREKVSAEEQKARLPNQTFRDRITLYLGGKEIQILYVGRAHTRGDSIVYVPQDRIVYLSELFFANQFLFINDGYGLDWLKALDAVEALGAEIFVPGHGPIPADPRETRQELRRFRQMLVDVRDAVQKEIARGATEDQAVATIRWPQYEKMQSYDAQRETAVRRLYQQLTGALK